MKELVKTFKVLSDETRLRILSLVIERECCVCEVMQALEISQSKASRGLTSLYDAGFLKFRKNGLWTLYSIDREEMRPYSNEILQAITAAFTGNKLIAVDRERLKETQREGQGCSGKICTEQARS